MQPSDDEGPGTIRARFTALHDWAVAETGHNILAAHSWEKTLREYVERLKQERDANRVLVAQLAACLDVSQKLINREISCHTRACLYLDTYNPEHCSCGAVSENKSRADRLLCDNAIESALQWLAEREAEVRAQALEEAAKICDGSRTATNAAVKIREHIRAAAQEART